MTPRSLGALTALVVALAIAVAVDRPRPRVAGPGRDRVVPGFRADALARLSLRAPGRPETILAREGAAGLVLVAPGRVPVDRRAAGELLGAIEYLAVRGRVPRGVGDDRGLGEPRLAVTLELEGGRRVELRVGRREAGLGRAWVATSERPGEALLVDEHEALALDRRADELRARAPFGAVGEGDPVRIEVGGRVLELRGRPACVALAGGCALADPARSAALRAGLAELRAARFLDGASLEASAARVRVGDAELRVGGACPEAPSERLTASAVGIACVRDEALRPILAAAAGQPEEWVARTPIPVPEEVRRVELGDAAAGLTLERSAGGAWQGRLGGAPLPVEGRAVAEWLEELAGYRALAVRPVEEPSRSGAPEGRVLLEGKGLRVEVTLRPGVVPGRVLVRRRGEPVELEVHGSLRARLEPGRLLFRDRRVFPALDPWAVSAVERQAAGAVEAARRGEAADAWEVIAPVAVAADRGAVGALREAIAGLRAERWIADRPAPEHGLEPPRARVVVTVDGPTPARATLELGVRTADGGCVARVTADDTAASGPSPVFELAPAPCDALETPLATRQVLDDLPEEIAAVEIAGVRAVRDGDAARWTDADGVPVPRWRVEELAALVESLATAAAVDGYGALPAAGRVAVAIEGPSGRTVLRFAGRRYAREGRPVVYRVPAAVCDRWATLCR